jgi:hypothetical protein
MLRLAALDSEDLGVISAHMQDAVMRVGDIAWRKGGGQFALVANRYVWDAGSRSRCRTGLHFDRVLSVKSQNIRRTAPDAVLSLLSIGFVESDPPAGEVLLTFSGGGTIRLQVECLEAQMKDLGPEWETARQPSHPIDGGDSP